MEPHGVRGQVEGEDRPSRDVPCPHCGLTGEPMVDWCGYAAQLEGLVAELLACFPGPPLHLADVLERLDVRPAASRSAVEAAA
jgi:hypothetical protein